MWLYFVLAQKDHHLHDNFRSLSPLPRENKDLLITVTEALSQTHQHKEQRMGSKGTCPLVCLPLGMWRQPLSWVVTLPWKWMTERDHSKPQVLEMLKGYSNVSPSPCSDTKYSLPKLRHHHHLCVPRCPLSDSSNLGELTFILPSAV